MRKILENKKKVTAIALVLLMTSVMLAIYTPVIAQDEYENMQEGGSLRLPAGVTPDFTVDSVAHLSFRPNPVGVGQTILVNLWITPGVDVCRYQTGYTVTITDPDLNEDVIGPMDSYMGDSTAWFEYVVDQVGEWTLQFDFPGGYFPAGNYTRPPGAFGGGGVTEFEESAYYKPASSGELTLTVQEDMVYSWPPSPLPTDYWTRPAHVENREWWPILGNWPATGYVGGGALWDELYPDTNPYYHEDHKFTPWVQGPNSAHIVWKRQDALAGLIGGQAQQYGTTGSPSSPNIIYAGRCYDTYSKPGTGSSAQYMWRCYDLRTGEVYWEQPAQTTTMQWGPWTFTTTLAANLIEYASPTQSEVEGAEAAGTWSVNLMYIGGGNLYKWNPWTGALTTNRSISPLSSATYVSNSAGRDSDPMAWSIQNLGYSVPADQRYRLIKWTTRGSTSNFTSRVVSNTSYARSSLPSFIDFETGLGATVSGVTEAGVFVGQTIRGYNLETGEELWEKTVPEPTYSFICNIVDHGKVAILSAYGYYIAFDLRTGTQVWKSETMDYPWASAGFGAYSAMSAYGMLFRESMDGVYAFNWTNGKIEWKYEAPANPYESPYTGKDGSTVYPFYSFGVGGIIADGKFYTWNYEHTESWPVTRGWKIHCIDIFTGEGIWNMTGCMTPSAIADGYLTAANRYDGYLYVFGRGKSATSIEASPEILCDGDTVMIKGTVLDLSPAQPNTPCVSKDSMGPWMDYLHMQMPIPADVTGVPVSLDTIDPNGNFVHIGDVTTDMSGMFKKMWTPEITGEYTVFATFMGDDSYGSSYAETAVGVVDAPEPPPEPVTPATEPEVQENIDRAIESLTPILYGTIVAVAIAIVIGIISLLDHRRLRK